MTSIQDRIRELITETLEEVAPELETPNIAVEYPQDETHGDLSSNIAMMLAGQLGTNPRELAQRIADDISSQEPEEFTDITVAGPGFINFTLSHNWLTNQITATIDRGTAGEHPFFSNIGKGRTVVIEHTSTNIAKPMSVGHFRAAILGDALHRIYDSLGYDTIAHNYVGDWGTQFGILLYAYKRFGDEEKVASDPINELNNLYVEFNKLMAEKPSLRRKGKEEFRKLEDGDEENRKLWEWFIEVSNNEFHQIFTEMGLKGFDHELGESFMVERTQPIVDELLKNSIAEQGKDGSIYVDLEPHKLGRFIAVKSDGATTYGLRDLANYLYRKKEWKFDQIVYVVGSPQAHHFRQVFKVLELLGRDPSDATHVSFGQITDASGGKMSTRAGNTITAKEMIARAISHAYKVIEEKSPDLETKDDVAEVVGIGALKYVNLAQNHTTDTRFVWDEILRFDGNTAPYLQYTFARTQSLISRANLDESHKPTIAPDTPQPKQDRDIATQILEGADLTQLTTPEEVAILRHLYRLNNTVEHAGRDFAPNYIAEYLHDLAARFNEFYAKHKILTAETQELRLARLALTMAVSIQLQDGLDLLGIEVVKEM